MNLAEILQSPWAITPAMFSIVRATYERHVRGEVVDLATIEAKLGRPLNNARVPMTVTPEGVAIIAIEGVIAKRANLVTQISGGTSAEIAGQEFAQALADPAVTAIMLAIDSPGGTVDGSQQLAAQIFAGRGRKPLTAHIDGMGCSAAYWLASACDQVVMSGPTAQAGSIGVIATHVDQSSRDATAGLKYTEVTSGPFKGATSAHKPLSDTGFATLQAAVDYTHALFAGDVGKHRGLSGERLAAVTDGRVFFGSQAVDAGLVDRMGSVEDVVGELANRSPSRLSAARPRNPAEIRAAAERMVAQTRALGRSCSLQAAIAMVSAEGIPYVE